MATSTATTIPSSLRARIMARAWEIFRASYNYPRVPFRSIGKACFASALRIAWHEAREIVRLAKAGVEVLTEARDAAANPRQRVGLETNFWERSEDRLRRRDDVRMAKTVSGRHPQLTMREPSLAVQT